MEMRNASEHHAREGDLSRIELLNQGSSAAQDGWTVYFKFSCAWCGERCQFNEPNKLYAKGECAKCGQETIVDVGGFLLASKPLPEPGDSGPETGAEPVPPQR